MPRMIKWMSGRESLRPKRRCCFLMVFFQYLSILHFCPVFFPHFFSWILEHLQLLKSSNFVSFKVLLRKGEVFSWFSNLKSSIYTCFFSIGWLHIFPNIHFKLVNFGFAGYDSPMFLWLSGWWPIQIFVWCSRWNWGNDPIWLAHIFQIGLKPLPWEPATFMFMSFLGVITYISRD